MGGNDTIATRRLEIVKIISEAPETRSFVFREGHDKLKDRAGQFLTFLFRGRHGREVRRSYSISSCPDLNEPLAVTVRRIPNGEISRVLMERTRAGDFLTTIGPSGFFILPENMSGVRRIVFVAAGSGITPVFSLLKSVLHSHPAVGVLLLYSNRNVKNTIFHRQLHELHEVFKERFAIEYLFSSSHDLSRSRLTPEALRGMLNTYRIDNFSDTLFYVCGPGDYMRMVSIALVSFGVPQKNIKKEVFHIQRPALVPAPPDTEEHTVHLKMGGEAFAFGVRYPVTILQAARLLQVPIPYSCENGQCGTCVAKCLQGQVWMSRNDVLLDEEIADGLVLTCTGFPVSGDVVLKI